MIYWITKIAIRLGNSGIQTGRGAGQACGHLRLLERCGALFGN